MEIISISFSGIATLAVSAIVIVKWAYDLIQASGKDLLDYTT